MGGSSHAAASPSLQNNLCFAGFHSQLVARRRLAGLAERNLARGGIHCVDNSERLQVVAAFAQARTAGLEALLNRDSDSLYASAC